MQDQHTREDATDSRKSQQDCLNSEIVFVRCVEILFGIEADVETRYGNEGSSQLEVEPGRE